MNEENRRYLFVGLGNPGKKYEMTRHNIGYQVIRTFADHHSLALKENKQIPGYVAKGEVGNGEVHLLLPTTYMNESGTAVQRYCHYYKFRIEEIVVIADDIALPFRRLRLRRQGSSGGHNGLKNIQKHLNSTRFARLRLGIGHHKEDKKVLSDYVLSPYTKEEALELPEFLEEAADVLKRITVEEMDTVMNRINQKVNQKKTPEGVGEEKDES